MKGKEPIINRRIKKIFRNHKYQVFMINEFKTSKLCNVCENVCSTFLKRESKSPIMCLRRMDYLFKSWEKLKGVA
jgi:hypothetical protein